MKTVWEYSIKTEAERLLHCARQIAVGFYRVNNFIVLPYSPKSGNALSVTFPNLPYTKIPRFWEKAKHLDVENLPLKIDATLVKQVENLLTSAKLPEPNYLKTKNLWQKAQDKVMSEIYKVIPDKRGVVKKITIYPTSFGTSASFNFIDSKGEIIIYLREDQGIHTITEAIITSITRAEIYNDLGGVWCESEIITDWLVVKSSIGKVLQKYEPEEVYIPTVKKIRIKEQTKLTRQSEEFYKKLGLSFANNIFGLNGKIPEINKKPIENLSAKEKLIMKLLIEQQGGILTFDAIGDLDNDNFSLYAIAKTIQRLRDKLELNGVSGNYIQTIRGKGYLLKN